MKPVFTIQTSRQGFTLLEVMVATSISLVLILVLMTAASTMMESFKRDEGTITRLGDASFAIDQIVQDFEGYVVPNIALAESIKSTPEDVQDLLGTDGDATWLTLLSTATDTDTSTPVSFTGATRAISYRLAYQNPFDATDTEDQVYALYRTIQNAKTTFDNAVGADVEEATGALKPGGLQKNFWEAEGIDTEAVENFVAANVVRFQVRFMFVDDNGTPGNTSDDEVFWTVPESEVRIGADGSSGTIIRNGSPQIVRGEFKRAEVILTVLTPAGAQELARPLNGENPQDRMDRVIRKHGQTYVRQTAFF